MNHLISKISQKYNNQTFQNRIDCPHTTSRSISNWSWNLLTFQHFHLWVENFKNRNRSIPSGFSIPELGFGFFDVKSLLYIKCIQYGYVLVALHKYLIRNASVCSSIILKNLYWSEFGFLVSLWLNFHFFVFSNSTYFESRPA